MPALLKHAPKRSLPLLEGLGLPLLEGLRSALPMLVGLIVYRVRAERAE